MKTVARTHGQAILTGVAPDSRFFRAAGPLRRRRQSCSSPPSKQQMLSRCTHKYVCPTRHRRPDKRSAALELLDRLAHAPQNG
jgi:hypothetical protein